MTDSEKKLLEKEEENSLLKAQIEKMKNCDNCKFLIRFGQYGEECRNFSCRHASLWELKE